MLTGDAFVLSGPRDRTCASPCDKVAIGQTGTEEDLIQEGHNGYLVERNHFEALAIAIRKIIEEPGKAQIMGNNSRCIIEDKFNIGAMSGVFEYAVCVATGNS